VRSTGSGNLAQGRLGSATSWLFVKLGLQKLSSPFKKMRKKRGTGRIRIEVESGKWKSAFLRHCEWEGRLKEPLIILNKTAWGDKEPPYFSP